MMGGTGSTRSLSRSAHSEKWVERKRFRTLRRLSQQALRAKGRGDQGTMDRLAHILHRIAPNLFSDLGDDAQTVLPDGSPVFQKLDPPGQEERGGVLGKSDVYSKGDDILATDKETA